MSKKIAIPIWQDRVSPVMDTAGQMKIIDYFDGHENGYAIEIIPRSHLVQKAAFLKNLGIDLLICGAISRHLHQILVSSGIDVIPFVHGPVVNVIEAYAKGELKGENSFFQNRKRGFWCYGHRRYRRGSNFDR